MMFNTLGLPAPLVQAVRAAGWTEPTAIQGKAIPVILQGNDLIGNAPSGSGKTGAFLLPGFARLLDGPQKLRALVLTPTREHAAQVETHARDFARFTELRVGMVHTASPIANQEKVLRDQGVDVLVATVDRLLELHERTALDFEDVEILVLDEADRMVDMGQATDIRKLLKLLPETRQTLLFSATMPAELNRLAKEALIEPVRVDLTSPQPSAGITHAIYQVPKHLKIQLLDRLLSRSGEVRSTIVFTRQREGADRLARQLERLKYAVATLHERKSQTERERAMEDLKRGRLQIVVTTDLAARGLELAGVAHVVNFDVPPTPEDYVHRIGRAGRPDAQGDAFTLMAPEEQRHLAAIERFVGRAIPRVMLPDFDYHLKPSQLQQTAIYDDERLRARKAAIAKNPYLAGRQTMPLAGAPRPTSPNSRSRGPAAASLRPKPAATAPAVARMKPKGIAVKVNPVAKPVVKPVLKPAAKPAAKPAPKPVPKPVAKKPAVPVAKKPAPKKAPPAKNKK
ncbi:MAG: DEAD/DEAH box helicase [Candidatus Eisenbacteria bacterium]|uniref:DEAD/DEAH box helicase n=1 Tax=Eiseniibacteriota bacterium TaxID=2212470 RepID=A0A933SDM6_UNCEI|nr:DEAD/DEAH box helicase [Candidatus Eisenbacteria bacterium]